MELSYFIGLRDINGEYEKDEDRLFQMTTKFNKADGRLRAVIDNTQLDSKILKGLSTIDELADQAVYIMNTNKKTASDINNANKISEMIKKNITDRMDNAYYEYFHNLVSGLIDPIMRQFCFEYTMTLTRSKIILNAIINKDLFNLHQYQFVSNITSSYLIFDNKEEESNNEQ